MQILTHFLKLVNYSKIRSKPATTLSLSNDINAIRVRHVELIPPLKETALI